MACTAIIIDRVEIDQIIEHDAGGAWRAIVKREVADLKGLGFGSSVTSKVFESESLAYQWADTRG